MCVGANPTNQSRQTKCHVGRMLVGLIERHARTGRRVIDRFNLASAIGLISMVTGVVIAMMICRHVIMIMRVRKARVGASQQIKHQRHREDERYHDAL